MAGPLVTRMLTPISAAMIPASVVLPRPGGSTALVERLAAHFCGFDIYAQVFLGLGLTDVIRHRLGAERIFGLVLEQLPGEMIPFIIRHAAGKFNTQRNTLPITA